MKSRQKRKPRGNYGGGSFRKNDAPSGNDINSLILYFTQKRYAEGETLAKKLAINFPQNGIIWKTLGAMLSLQGKETEAIEPMQKAAYFLPEDGETHINLGIILLKYGRLNEAEASLKRASDLKPDCADIQNSLGIALKGQGRLTEAEACYRRALEIKPDYAEAQNNLGTTLKDFGRFAEAETGLRRALKIRPDYAEAYSNLLFCLNYNNDISIYEHVEEAGRYGQMVAKKVETRFSTWLCTKHPERLRVGIVSGDMCNHSVGHFLESILSHVDSSKIELIAYSTHYQTDELTERIKPSFSAWRSLVNEKDQDAADLIHKDGIHVLFDLSGHTAHNRLPVFAWKPAPVQVSWLGYSGTTGVAEIDYYLADPFVVPPGEDDHFTEKIWRLPESYLCFSTPDVSVEVGSLPAEAAGRITFGCFNNLSKMNNDVVALWSRLLCAVTGSALFLRTSSLSDITVFKNTINRFAGHGIPADRLILDGTFSSRKDLFEAYNRVDLALDPFPYAGTTTSIEALWMGVPVITRRGRNFISHVGESILHNAGLDDWIAENDDDYVEKAVLHTANLENLATLRTNLRRQVLASPLFDASRFARHFEDALWTMWKNRFTN